MTRNVNLVAPAKFNSSQRPALIRVLQSLQAEDFGQFLKQALTRSPATGTTKGPSLV
jgi:hypothetical protein